jgi:hypothetical protein
MNQFLDKIVTFAEKNKIPLDILVEGRYWFSPNLKQIAECGDPKIRDLKFFEEDGDLKIHFYYPHCMDSCFVGPIVWSPNKGAGTHNQTTWLIDIYRMLPDHYNYVSFRSIDPRFTASFWSLCSSAASLKDLFTMGDIQKYKYSEEYERLRSSNRQLKREIKKMDRQIEFDQAALKSHIQEWNDQSERSLLSESNEDLLQKGLLTQTSIDKITAELKSNSFYFIPAMDKLTFLETARSQSLGHSTILLIGAVHAKNLEKHFLEIGYSKDFKMNRDGQFVEKALRVAKIYKKRHEQRDHRIKIKQSDLDCFRPVPEELVQRTSKAFSRIARRLKAGKRRITPRLNKEKNRSVVENDFLL